MKKKVVLSIILTASTVIGITGCGSNTVPVQTNSDTQVQQTDSGEKEYTSAGVLAEEVTKALNNVNSFSFDEYFTIDANLSMYGQTTDMKQQGKGSGEIQINPEYAHLNLDLTSNSAGNSASANSESYISGIGADSKGYIRTNGGNWRKDTSVTGIEFGTLLEQFIGKKVIESIATGETQASIENNGGQVNGRDTYKLSANVNGELAGASLSDALSSLQATNTDWSSLYADMDIYIYKSEKLPAKICIKGDEFLEGVMAGMGIDCNVKEYFGEFTLDNYKMGLFGDLEIPEDVLKEAGEDLSKIGVQFGNTTTPVAISAKDYNRFYKHNADIYKSYVQMGDYKGLDVTKIDRTNENITEENINEQLEAIKEQFLQNEDVTEGGTTQKDDIITLAYVGKIDGVAFEGGSSEEATYTVGSGNYIEDLDKGLEGKQAGKEFDVNVKFPDDYGNEELNGKSAVFTVKISQIFRPKAPKINDEFVKANAEELENEGFGSGLATVDDLKKGIRSSMVETAKINNNQQILSQVIEKLKETSKIQGFPNEELEYVKENIKNNLEAELSRYNGYYNTTMTIDDYVKEFYEAENFDAYIESFSKDYLTGKMLVTLIGSENDIDVSVEEFNNAAREFVSAYGYDSYQDMIYQYGSEMNCAVGYNILYDKVAALLAENSNEV